MNKPTQRLALISGASSGIGRATALALAQQGYDLMLLARRQSRLQQVQTEAQKINPKIQVHLRGLDVTDRPAMETWVKQDALLLQDLEVLVNNAGLARGTDRLHEAKLDDWDAMLDTNVKSLLWMTRLVLPHFVAKNRGHIVNLGSVAGRWVYPGGAVYCATKFAVRAISEGLRMDLLGKNIRVTNIEPGMVQTEFAEVRLQSKEQAAKIYAGMKPLTGEDIAETIAWVVARPPHVNIQELVIYPTDQASTRDVHRS